ncbi:hypothetical protein [Pararhizobium sp.]|uniref:hypothetical protein n=1 Tax=Pararhizobium sp. TaxID=1977563 RepID=UPI002725B9B9|nr:hypothetical protein [Pararhizobium sp.]MDO9415904.1 hypothetical protein [Pararhizobium sp.]
MSVADHLSPCDIALSDRPLIVCDIDEVVLEFIVPLTQYLRAGGLDLLPRSFRLHGNVVSLETGAESDEATVSAQLEDFFCQHDQWQFPAPLAVETLNQLAADADIVFLTAMPPRHAAIRRALLDSFGLHFPLMATEEAKGPMVKTLHRDRDLPVIFIDDIVRNLHSVREHAPDCLLINIMANRDFLAMAPDPGEGVRRALDWTEAAAIILDHLHARKGSA